MKTRNWLAKIKIKVKKKAETENSEKVISLEIVIKLAWSSTRSSSWESGHCSRGCSVTPEKQADA